VVDYVAVDLVFPYIILGYLCLICYLLHVKQLSNGYMGQRNTRTRLRTVTSYLQGVQNYLSHSWVCFFFSLYLDLRRSPRWSSLASRHTHTHSSGSSSPSR
jgi:hypothetical protein